MPRDFFLKKTLLFLYLAPGIFSFPTSFSLHLSLSLSFFLSFFFPLLFFFSFFLFIWLSLCHVCPSFAAAHGLLRELHNRVLHRRRDITAFHHCFGNRRPGQKKERTDTHRIHGAYLHHNNNNNKHTARADGHLARRRYRHSSLYNIDMLCHRKEDNKKI